VALPGVNKTIVWLELNHFACGTKISASASGGPAGGRRVAVCLVRWRAMPMLGQPRFRTANEKKNSLRFEKKF
jgi:hypothetical protein